VSDSAALSDDEFAVLYRRYRSVLVWHVRSHGATDAEASDAVQEAFAHALRARDQVRHKEAWPTWLRTVAVRSYSQSLLRCRSPRLRGPVSVMPVPGTEMSERLEAAGVVGDIAEAHWQEEFVLSLLASLPGRQRRVFTLHYEGWMTAEIAAHLAMSEAAVRQNIARARSFLRSSLMEMTE
jgi:RNA polymerase sigma factor (sigma-70 family)